MIDKILIWGGQSYSRLIIDILENRKFYKKNSNLSNKYKIKGIVDLKLKKLNYICDYFLINNIVSAKKIIKESNRFITCIGSNHGKARYLISNELEKLNLTPIKILDKKSSVDDNVNIGKGSHVMRGALVNSFSKVGNYTILNTSSNIEHECIIGNGVHIMSNATLGGRVIVEDYVTIGMNATIFPDVKIGEGAFVGAGSVVRKNVKKNEVVIGNPSKYLKKNRHFFDLSFFK
tara:strand:- start:174 stop:872 length:699 start_codon:yes stop_codon:yes gene_type:complete